MVESTIPTDESVTKVSVVESQDEELLDEEFNRPVDEEETKKTASDQAPTTQPPPPVPLEAHSEEAKPVVDAQDVNGKTFQEGGAEDIQQANAESVDSEPSTTQDAEAIDAGIINGVIPTTTNQNDKPAAVSKPKPVEETKSTNGTESESKFQQRGSNNAQPTVAKGMGAGAPTNHANGEVPKSNSQSDSPKPKYSSARDMFKREKELAEQRALENAANAPRQSVYSDAVHERSGNRDSAPTTNLSWMYHQRTSEEVETPASRPKSDETNPVTWSSSAGNDESTPATASEKEGNEIRDSNGKGNLQEQSALVSEETQPYKEGTALKTQQKQQHPPSIQQSQSTNEISTTSEAEGNEDSNDNGDADNNDDNISQKSATEDRVQAGDPEKSVASRKSQCPPSEVTEQLGSETGKAANLNEEEKEEEENFQSADDDGSKRIDSQQESAVDTNNNEQEYRQEEPAPPTTRQRVAIRYTIPPRPIVPSIVVRQTEETLHILQSSLREASVNLFQSLGDHLSQQGSSIAGMSLPASAVGWLANQTTPEVASLHRMLPRLTHLRLTMATWPPTSPAASSDDAAATNNNTENPTLQQLQQQYASLQSFYRLRYNPKVNVALFSNLQVLLLDKVPPNWILHLPKLQTTLQVLRVEHASLHDLEALLVGSDETGQFTCLSHLKLNHCNLGEQTKGLAPTTNNKDNTQRLPLACMPNLVSLSLAQNKIRSEKTILESGITHSPLLSKLDLSYNQITTFCEAPLYIGNLQTLLLTGNQLQSAEGLDRLYALKTLALDHNQIRSWLLVAKLARLPELQILKLKGNPFMEADRAYVRVMMLDLFREQRWSSSISTPNEATFRQLEFLLPVLDNKPASDRELKALRQRAFVTVSTTIGSRGANGVEIPDRPIAEEDWPVANTPGSGATASEESASLSEGWTIVPRAPKIKRKKRKVATAIIEDEFNSRRPIRDRRALHREASLQPMVHKAPTTEEAQGNLNSAGCSGLGEEKKENGNKEPKVQIQGSSSKNQKGKRHASTANRKGNTPKLAFGIHDVIVALSPDDPKSTGTLQAGDMQQDSSAPPTQSAAELVGCKGSPNSKVKNSGASTKKFAEFEWPQPLPYLPKENLYEEFVWAPVTTVSLSEEMNAEKKQKAKKKKRKAKKKAPPATKNDTAEGQNVMLKTKNKSPPAKSDKSPSRVKQSSESPKGKATSAKSNGHGGQPEEILEWDNLPGLSDEKADNSEEVEMNGTTNEQSSASPNRSNASGNARRRQSQTTTADDEGSLSSDGEDANDLMSPQSRTSTGISFPSMAMEVGAADDTTCSSNATGRSSKLRGPSKQDKFKLAEMKSKFLGMEHERGLDVASNLTVYFKHFVFPDPSLGGQLKDDTDTWQSVFFRYPRVQLLPKDRELRETFASKQGKTMEMQTASAAESRERFVKVWREDVVACGKPALRRLPPNRTAHFGFHGELSWLEGKVKTVSECRGVIICLSNTSLYIISDNDSLTAKEEAKTAVSSDQKSLSTTGTGSPTKSRQKRKYPSPLPPDATFEQALWPHAVACHPLADVLGITIGFGFQRMVLRIRNSAYPSAVEFTYQLLTSNKMKTVDLLRELQSRVKEVNLSLGSTTLTDEAIKIDNDDRVFLDALASAVAPEPLGAVLHYQVLKQRWKHGQRGAVSRTVVVTDAKIFLLDEDYVGDGSESVSAEGNRRLGSPSFRLIDAADLQQISEVKAADADPNAITIIIRPSQKLQRTHRWRLLCRDRSGAEKLVEDVRKAIALADM